MKEITAMNPDDVRLRERLQSAVRSTAVPPHLETRVRAAILAGQRPGLAYARWALAASLAVVILSGVFAYQFGYLRLTRGSQEAYIDSVTARVAAVMRAGLRDHIHCAVFRRYPQNPPALETVVSSLNPEYRPLVEIVRRHVPSNFRLMLAHECRHRGRKFVHLALKSDSRLISLVLTRKTEGESFAASSLLPPVRSRDGIPVYRAGANDFEIAAVESSSHLAYVISDLPGRTNMELMLALAADVSGFLSTLEG